ncbi:MAG: TIGR03643 family protein [Lutibacter sp.]|nr:TIGR03643 family protein [Lutibacter sp.]MDT8418610.1 TIGR03643 family protein [Lutibacter sp.]
MTAADYITAEELNGIAIERIIEMAWEDRTPFEAIQFQFGLAEKEVIKLMRNQLKLNSFNLWRKRVNSKISQKHLKKRSEEITRFKCSRQRTISLNKISKR